MPKRTTVNITIIFFAIFFIFTEGIFSQVLLRDDFQIKQNHWYWRADGNQEKPTVKNGLLKLQLENAVDSFYCNTEIYNPTEPYTKEGTQVRIRLKASNIHYGSRGWGFWDGDIWNGDNIDPRLIYDFDVAWLMQQGSKLSGDSYNWFQFGVSTGLITDRITKDLDSLLDETKWHTYKINWQENIVTLHIDGILIFETEKNIPDDDMRVDIWIDNRVLNLDNPADFKNVNSESSKMFVDFVEVSGTEGAEIKRALPSNIIFWNSPNSFPNGDENFSWKKFNINSNSEGKAYLFLTGSAETYNNIQPSDELKIKFNNTDFGWKNNFSFNGNILQGKGKSILKEVDLKQNNLLEIITNSTPFLKDVILLHSSNGKLIFSEEYNETASITDGLWKTININASASSNATLLISGNANDDDAIKIIVDDKDYGWTGNYALNGTELQNFPNTIVLELNLDSGEHKIEIHKKGNPTLYRAVLYGTSTITDIENEIKIDTELKLTANPNPFNNSTVINYTLPQSAKTNITIYNSIGQVVKTLVNEEKEKGSHRLNWNAENISSGLYFCVIKSGANIKVRKLMLLK